MGLLLIRPGGEIGRPACRQAGHAIKNAAVAKLADAIGLGPIIRKGVWVQLPPAAPSISSSLSQGTKNISTILLIDFAISHYKIALLAFIANC